MTSAILIHVSTISTAGWTVSVIAILIVAAIAWNVFGGNEDLRRVRRRVRRRGRSGRDGRRWA